MFLFWFSTFRFHHLALQYCSTREMSIFEGLSHSVREYKRRDSEGKTEGSREREDRRQKGGMFLLWTLRCSVFIEQDAEVSCTHG